VRHTLNVHMRTDLRRHDVRFRMGNSRQPCCAWRVQRKPYQTRDPLYANYNQKDDAILAI